MKLDFLIFYEHASREMESGCYLASILEKRGYRVKLINRRFLGRIFLNPRVIVTPYLYGDEDVHEFTGYLCGRKRAIVDLQYEQIYNNARLESDFSKPTFLSSKATHICWGNATRERLIKEGISASNLPVTGAMSMDFNLPQLRVFLKGKKELAKEFGLDVNKSWHLFISSFVYCSLSQTAIDSIEKKIPGYTPFVDIAKKTQIIIIDWIKSMAVKHPEQEFIYRPHPNEYGTETLKVLNGCLPNVKVIPNYSIRQWVTVCETSSNWYSTSIADSYFAGRPCCVLRPIQIPPKFEIRIMEGCDFIQTIDGYDSFLSQSAPKVCPLEMGSFSDYYLTDRTRLFGERVADACEEVLNSGEFPYSRFWKDCMVSFKYDLLATLFRLFTKMGASPKSRFYEFHRMAENTRADRKLQQQYMKRFREYWEHGG